MKYLKIKTHDSIGTLYRGMEAGVSYSRFFFGIAILAVSCFIPAPLNATQEEEGILIALKSEISELETKLALEKSKLSSLMILERSQPLDVARLNHDLVELRKRKVFVNSKLINDPQLASTGVAIIAGAEISNLNYKISLIFEQIMRKSPRHADLASKIYSTEGEISNLVQSIDSKKMIVSELQNQHELELERVAEIADLKNQISRSSAETMQFAYENDKRSNFKTTERLEVLLADMQKGEVIYLNGERIRIHLEGGGFRFLGDGGGRELVRQGVNMFSNESSSKAVRVWIRGLQIEELYNPYKDSYAILVAIDDYSNFDDYITLGNMVKNAQNLKKRLMHFGFPDNNIVILDDSNATKDSIEQELDNFTIGKAGGKKADRLFFYFGGHGDHLNDIGYLVASDYDPSNPIGSSFLTRRFIAEYFVKLDVHHFLVAIDACSSGLALDGMIGLNGKDKVEEHVIGVAHVETEYSKSSREMLVAGVSDDKAIWLKDGGGLFTIALKNALKLDAELGADANNDGVIRMSEISNYIDDIVRGTALMIDTKQTPRYWRSTIRHQGSMLFVSDPQEKL